MTDDCDDVVETADVMDGAKHLVKAALIGIQPDGRLYIAGTHGAALSLALFERAVQAMEDGRVQAPAGGLYLQ